MTANHAQPPYQSDHSHPSVVADRKQDVDKARGTRRRGERVAGDQMTSPAAQGPLDTQKLVAGLCVLWSQDLTDHGSWTTSEIGRGEKPTVSAAGAYDRSGEHSSNQHTTVTAESHDIVSADESASADDHAALESGGSGRIRHQPDSSEDKHVNCLAIMATRRWLRLKKLARATRM